MANKFSVGGSEKLRKIMGRTRGVFSSPKAEGARGFKSPSLAKQAAIFGILWRTPRNSHVCALPRAPESDRMGLFWAHSVDFSPRRSEAGPFADQTLESYGDAAVTTYFHPHLVP
jgi:hypothetical protein